jgi:putative aldouronate transport system substrate-binding protein
VAATLPLGRRRAGARGAVSTFQLYDGNQLLVPQREENRYWRTLEQRLGATLTPTAMPPNGYGQKLYALTASRELPDLVFHVIILPPDQVKAFGQGAYTDLTPYLTGAALADYPNLAAFPARTWQSIALGGKLHGVPYPAPLEAALLVFRQDWAARLGTPQPRDADDFLRLLVAMAQGDPGGNGRADRHGLGAAKDHLFNLPALQALFRVPDRWRLNPDGSLVNAIETEEFRQAVAYLRRLSAAGVYHPEAGTMTREQVAAAFMDGRVGGYIDSLTTLPAAGLRGRMRCADPAADVVGLVSFGHDGGRGVAYTAAPARGLVAIPATVGKDSERVKELLRILDYYAAPFGSEERLFLDYGLAGLHHEVRPDGAPALTPAGKQEIGYLREVLTGPPAYYYPDYPGEAAYMQGLARDLLAIGVDDPVERAFSPTARYKLNELTRLHAERLTPIITGRAPLGALDDYVKEWRRAGGDRIRQEYEAALRA